MRGMTLIELITVVAILGLVSAALAGAIQFFYRSNAFLLEQTAALESARQGVRGAVVAIREASYGDDGSFPIQTAATSSITFYSDFDRDDSVEKETYRLLNGTLYRVVTNSGGSPPGYTGQPMSTSTVATYVRNTPSTPLFRYFDPFGVELSATSTDVSRIASVTITLMVDLNPNRAPNVFTLSETATLRNLRATE